MQPSQKSWASGSNEKLLLLSTSSSGSVGAAPPAVVDGLAVAAVVVLLLRAGLDPGPARRRRMRRPQPEEAVVGRGRGKEGVLLGDHARLLVVGRVGLAQHQAARGGESSVCAKFSIQQISIVLVWQGNNIRYTIV